MLINYKKATRIMPKSSRLQSVGEFYHSFQLVKAVLIPEIQCFLREFIHLPTGAQVMHIENEDPENVFCLSFQTLPSNSNGVAHILEHTVLCGSEKFPIKDPFFAMTRRSLNTFMNALTGADFTCYPAASQIPKDFYNLLDVYLDAVFHPHLNEMSFLQEGHRLEFTNPTDSDSPLEYKGIVYNEMKGALSSPSSRLIEAINQHLFPDVVYGVNSGGDPKEIPSLTYERLKDFHKTFYHPSRCLFFFYGNMSIEKHLDFIGKQTLNQSERASPLPSIPLQPRFKKPVYRELAYPILNGEDKKNKTLIGICWLTCHILEQEEVLALSVLEVILMDMDASPLKRAILSSGLCKQANSFIDIEINEVPVGIILKGCNPEGADKLETIIRDALRELAVNGIPLTMVENAIHQLEFDRTEVTGDHAPFGLSIFMRSGLLKQHGANPEQGLMIHSLFENLRKKTLEEPRYFSELIELYFLNNPHFVRIVMKPDQTLQAKEDEEEKRLLKEIQHSLTSLQKKAIVDQALELAEFQRKQEEENIDILPKVSLNDVSPLNHEFILNQETIDGLQVFHHPVFTNDIVYADLVFDLTDIPEDDLPLLRLLTIALPQMGANDRDYAENLEYIQAHTGGIGAGINFNLQADDHFIFHPTFHIRGKSLHRKTSKLFSLIHDTIVSPQLNDLNRLKEIIFKHFTNLESQLNQGALKYAINLAASSLNIASKVANDLYGLSYYWRIKEIVQTFDQQGPALLHKLKTLQKKALDLKHPHLILSCDSMMYDEIKRHDFYGLKAIIYKKEQAPWKGDYSLSSVCSQGRLISSPVAFISQALSSVSYTHPCAPALKLAAFLLDNLTLHTKIREQGGAYGGGAVSNSLSGNFYFYSYRDPNIVLTLKAFKEAVEELLQGDFDEKEMEEAKLEVIQTLDSPISPGSQGEMAYNWLREGKTKERRQRFRQRLLELKKEEVIEAVETIIYPQLSEAAIVVFAGKELLEKENLAFQLEGLPSLNINTI